jgi:hypothetical protein
MYLLVLLKRMHLFKRRGNSTAKPEIKYFEEKKAKYLKEIETLVDKYDIPPQFIIKWDHTGKSPVSCYVYASPIFVQ